MKIITRLLDNIVLYLVPDSVDIDLTEQGVKFSKVTDPTNNKETVLVYTDITIPDNFILGMSTYDGTIWTHPDQSYYDNINQEKLDKIVQEKLIEVNSLRDVYEVKPFLYNDKLFDADHLSTQRIANTAISASLAISTNTPFNISWACADNTVMELDAVGMLSLQAALTQQVATIHYYARDLKEQVRTATLDTINSIDVVTGWPVCQ